MIYTGRYSGKYDENTVKVAISVGKPRWGGFEDEIKELAPYGIHGKYEGEEAKTRYMAQLERLGILGIKALFKNISSKYEGKDIILCCWENVSIGEECHRRWLAEFIYKHTGRELKEALEVAKAVKKQEPKQVTIEDFDIL
jgi:hypothetical protein